MPVKPLLALLAGLAVVACTASPIASTPVVPISGGSPPPSASFLDLDGKQHTVSEFKGQNLLLVVFAYWCPHCQEDMPQIQAYVTAHPGLQFVPVEGSKGTKELVTDFKGRFGLTGTVYYDPTGNVATDLDAPGYPTAFLFGADGTVIDKTVGAPPFERYNTLLAGGK